MAKFVKVHVNPDVVQVTEQSIQLSFASVVSSDCACMFGLCVEYDIRSNYCY